MFRFCCSEASQRKQYTFSEMVFRSFSPLNTAYVCHFESARNKHHEKLQIFTFKQNIVTFFDITMTAVCRSRHNDQFCHRDKSIPSSSVDKSTKNASKVLALPRQRIFDTVMVTVRNSNFVYGRSKVRDIT